MCYVTFSLPRTCWNSTLTVLQDLMIYKLGTVHNKQEASSLHKKKLLPIEEDRMTLQMTFSHLSNDAMNQLKNKSI